MNVPGVGSGAAPAATSWASPVAGGKWDNQFQGAMSSVANLLGSSASALQSSSKSLSQIASASGVGGAQLEAAIKAGLQSAGTQLTGTRLDNIAHRIAVHRHHGRPHASGSSTSSTSSTSSSSSTAASSGPDAAQTGWGATPVSGPGGVVL